MAQRARPGKEPMKEPMRYALLSLILGLCGVPAAIAQTTPPQDAAGTLPPNAATQPGRQRPPPLWSLDTNHDGLLSREEVQSRRGLSRHFDEIDTNHDGVLDHAEIRAWHQKMRARKQQRMQDQQAPQNPPLPDDSSGG